MDANVVMKWIFLVGVVVLLWSLFILYQEKQMKHLRDIQFTHIPQMEGFQRIKAGNNAYKVHEDLSNPQDAAKLMDQLNTTALTLIEQIDMKYKDVQAVSALRPEARATVLNGIAAMKKNFRTASLEENLPERSGGDTSFVIDKGDVFAMCLRDPKNNNQLDTRYNNLVFVLVHELSHLAYSGWGHPSGFWEMFKFLLHEATLLGLYTPINYKATGSPYCGIVITYSPLFDGSLASYYRSS